MDNMELWNKLNKPPSWALKPITGGRLKGMTDINPQWRYQAMTDALGPCGFGWKFEITGMWIVDGAKEEKVAFVNILLSIKDHSTNLWSDPIPGTGGSKFIAKETGGMHTSDECYKMAVTDALSTAMKVIGTGADIYMNRWDGSKYREVVDTTAPPEKINPVEFDAITKIIDDKGVDEKKFLEYMKVEGIEDILKSEFATALSVLKRAKGTKENSLKPLEELPEVNGEPRP